MDSLKFAFDTLIIGALALPWLWLFMRIFFQPNTDGKDLKFPLLDALSESTKQLLGGALILALGYFLGSAVSRISSDFFDDTEILHGLPTQTSIRQGVYLHEYCDQHSVLIASKLPGPMVDSQEGKAAFCREAGLMGWVSEFFGLQESRLLLAGDEKLARLREFHDQIEVLRGAALNGAILFTLSWFGLCGLYRARAPAGREGILRKSVSYLPAAACLLFGSWAMYSHFSRLGQAEVADLTCNPVPRGSGTAWTCRVTLTPGARVHDSKVVLASSNPSLVAVPGSVNVAADAGEAEFSATAAVTLSGNQRAAVTASLGETSRSAAISLSGRGATAPGNESPNTPGAQVSIANSYEGHRDPPLAEAVMILLGIGGLCVRLTDDNPRLYRNVCLIALVLTLIAYGSWWWTEVLYNGQVIHSNPGSLEVPVAP